MAGSTIEIGVRELGAAAAVVAEAAELTRRVQETMVSGSLAKGDKSPVTVGDFAAQALVAYRLGEFFPDAQLIGEENAASLREPANSGILEQVTKFVNEFLPGITAADICELIDRGAGEPTAEFWTLDPIDGTKGFLRGDQYAIALAYIVGGQVQAGLLGCPELENATQPRPGGEGTLMVARRGSSTEFTVLLEDDETQTARASQCVDPADARLLRSVESGHTNIDGIDQFAATLGITAAPVPMDSQAKYAVLAAGGGEMLLRLLSPDRPNYREKIWDQAAGSLVIEMAGGRVTDLNGKPLDFSHGRELTANRGVLATNGPLHDAALAALRQIGA
jgi:3'(2'), 5'-bisphosphate nucleotidase